MITARIGDIISKKMEQSYRMGMDVRLQEPRQCEVRVDDGRLEGADHRYEKRIRDLGGIYGDARAFSTLVESRGDEIAYEVTSFTPGDRVSDLITGVTRMASGQVGQEFFMTRGHIHAVGDRPEIYYGQAGEGLMQMESPEGEVRIVEIGPQTICYVPAFWIHRSVNVGPSDFVMMFAYPADSGQDYGIIERSGGMRVRIVDDGAGGWTRIDNPDWRARAPEDIARIYGNAA